MEGFHRPFSTESIENEWLIDSLHAKIEKQKGFYQSNPEDFLHESGYVTEEVQAEIIKTQQLKEKWSTQNTDKEKREKKISDIFEGILVDQLSGDWLAGKGQAFYASEPDDYLRKVDCVIEFSPEDEADSLKYLGLGIDVTFSSNMEVLEKKLDDIWNKDIAGAKLVPLKYVDTDNYKGSMEVCRTVLVADKETVYSLAQAYNKKDMEALNNHEFLANALLQIKYQLEAYYHYARSHNAKAKYLSAITDTLSTFYGIYSEKEEFLIANADKVEQSDVFKKVKQYCDARLGE